MQYQASPCGILRSLIPCASVREAMDLSPDSWLPLAKLCSPGDYITVHTYLMQTSNCATIKRPLSTTSCSFVTFSIHTVPCISLLCVALTSSNSLNRLLGFRHKQVPKDGNHWRRSDRVSVKLLQSEWQLDHQAGLLLITRHYFL